MALIAGQPAFKIDLSTETERRVYVVQMDGLTSDGAVAIYQRATGSADPVTPVFYSPDPETFAADQADGLMLIQVS